MLIAYDGSRRARHALVRAAELLRPDTVELITAWEPVTRQTARALGRTGLPQTTVEIDPEGEIPGHGFVADLISGVDKSGVAKREDVEIIL